MVKNVIKIAVSVVGAAVVGELGFNGALMLANDVHGTTTMVKQVVNPEPVKAKTGLFKTTNVVYNPITNKVRPYNGDKKPVNSKAVKLKPEYKAQLKEVK